MAGQLRVDRLAEAPRGPEGRIDLDAMVDRLGRDRVSVLESSPGTPHAIRWSFVALASGTRMVDDGRTTTLITAEGREPLARDPFVAIGMAAQRLGLGPEPDPEEGLPPFTGGLVGALSYDLARRVETIPDQARSDRDAPHLWFDVVTTLIAVDHDVEEAWLVQRPVPGIALADADELRARLRAGRDARPARPRASSRVTSTFRHLDYLRAVAAVLDRIAAGDVFQVNLTQRLTAPWDGDTHDLYRRLRNLSAAPHGAVIPAVGIASVSPETFVSARGHRVTMRPMKGTRPRTGSDDARARDELAGSAKDRAENVMVVDIERNDLGRVCRPGTVTAPRLCEIEAHPTVWQLVSTVNGQLRNDVGWGDLLRATFPCGSVTGAPKVAAMQVIESSEPVRRSWYCGAVGWIGAGSMRLSVAIRTAVVSGAVADYGAGGGIVADSDPATEYEESLTKAGPFLGAVGGSLLETRS